MSKPILAINRYRADLRELNFLVFEQFKLQELIGKGPFEAWGEDEIRNTFTEVYRFAREVTGPECAPADAEGCHFENGSVRTPASFKSIWSKLYEAGWKTIAVDPEHGGAGAPQTVALLSEEMISGSNTSFNMYPGLAMGSAEVIAAFGTHEQKELFCNRMFTGKWGGTMCLTESHAGSDVGSAKTSAKRNADGSYSIKGSKLYITGGDHDLVENIIHLVLARVEGAPAGTKGLTLFIVPKFHVAPDGTLGKRNDAFVTSIEHKMGLTASATCALNFGDSDECIGYPVGGDEAINRGMPQMFHMMNFARIGVGIQGIAIASTAYLNALEYARERKQGSAIEHWKDPTAPRVSILVHADVRRMLLDMKSRVEGLRALAVKLTTHSDSAKVYRDDEAKAAYHQGQVDLLVPLVKSYGSDQAFRICETAIQTYGGAGYTRDYPVEQYCRDAKIFSIYEGTNHIQAMDLVGRKLGQAGGANFQAFLGDVTKFVSAHSNHATLGADVKRLGAAQEAIAGSAFKLLGWFQSGQMDMVPLNANRFQDMMSEFTVSWMLLDAAVIAADKLAALKEGQPDFAFYSGKVSAAQYYVRNVLPNVDVRAKQMLEEDRSPLDIPDEAFATI